MTWLMQLPLLGLIMLQSNDVIGEAVGNGSVLLPDYAAYGGMTGIFGQFFLIMITWIGMLVQNYGLAIILTAIVVRLLLLPLTRTQVRGMRMMQQLQPVMKQIQRHYPNKQDQSAKTMELYQKYKINPLAGCLPMLIQLPILFGVYRALYDPTFAGKDFLGIQLLFPVNVTSGRSFGMGPELADLVDVTVAKLGLAGQMWQLPESVPLIGGSFWYIPALALVVFYIASTLYMQRLMRKVNAPDPEFVAEFEDVMKSKKADDEGRKPEPDMAQQMQKQMGIMNFVIIIFAFIFSAGALLYFIIQNVLMSVEYTLIPKMAGGAGPQLDARELKEFIRKPPPPTKQPGAKPRAPGDSGSASAESNKPSQGSAEQGDNESATSVLKRPRKKRRKR
jgi:YidC/Oxa1 family membrane protein insertase